MLLIVLPGYHETRCLPSRPALVARARFAAGTTRARAAGLAHRPRRAAPASGRGREALDLLARRRFDCILLDVLMPGMDGLEVARIIRTSPGYAAAAATPIIAVTAFAMNGDREKFLAAGMDDYIAKPIGLEELRAVIVRATAGRRTAQAPVSL
ncbi:response regulator [Solidesulfovibrio sp.]|uniref:response regulator n=1 Tax=Solidesulfovibrio sp. TaxID=2910990 RepID=UPI00262C5EA7|nr:response regulator [Solidesulfovibrio sp.]